MVEAVVGVVEAQDGEILGDLEDPRNRQASLGRVMDRGRRRAAGEALDVHFPARVEDDERFCGHRRALSSANQIPMWCAGRSNGSFLAGKSAWG